jgi:hypothetical protein
MHNKSMSFGADKCRNIMDNGKCLAAIVTERTEVGIEAEAASDK